jgi:hypothetical protein
VLEFQWNAQLDPMRAEFRSVRKNDRDVPVGYIGGLAVPDKHEGNLLVTPLPVASFPRIDRFCRNFLTVGVG